MDAMPVSFSIKDVPDDLAEALRERARLNHRSIQGELLAILESAVRPRGFQAKSLARYAETLGLQTPGESVQMIREDRDSR
jgi:plasmid stability protein